MNVTADIFVMIPSYKDSAILHTVSTFRAHATRKLRFGVFLQDDDPVRIGFLESAADVDLVVVHPRHARGCAFGRSVCWSMWQGEPWALSVDAHMEAHPGWDKRLITQAEGVGEKCVLSSPCVKSAWNGTVPRPWGFRGQGKPYPKRPEWVPYLETSYKVAPFPERNRPVEAWRTWGAMNFFTSALFDEMRWPPWVTSSLIEEAWFTAGAADAGFSLWHPEGLIIFHVGDMSGDRETGNARFWRDGGTCTEVWGMEKAREYFLARKARGAPGYEGYEGYMHAQNWYTEPKGPARGGAGLTTPAISLSSPP